MSACSSKSLRKTASADGYSSKLCFSNLKEFEGDESYCAQVDKVVMKDHAIHVTDVTDKTCSIQDKIMPITDLEQIKKSLDGGTANYLICVTPSQHIHTDKDAKNVLYIADDFNWFAAP